MAPRARAPSCCAAHHGRRFKWLKGREGASNGSKGERVSRGLQPHQHKRKAHKGSKSAPRPALAVARWNLLRPSFVKRTVPPLAAGLPRARRRPRLVSDFTLDTLRSALYTLLCSLLLCVLAPDGSKSFSLGTPQWLQELSP
jgi:hypothetical protein